jgi:hypothetical protein
MGAMRRKLFAREVKVLCMACSRAVIRRITIGLPWVMMTIVIDVVDVVVST